MSFVKAFIMIFVIGLVGMAVSAQSPQPAQNQRPVIQEVQPTTQVFGQRDMHLFQPGTVDFAQNFPGFDMHGPRAEELEFARQCESLVKQLAKAEGQDKEKLKAKLTETIDKQFEVRQKRHEAEITALENQLKKLKETVQKRQENRKEIVGKRYEQLIRESEGLGW
jgi:hypothetical protein